MYAQPARRDDARFSNPSASVGFVDYPWVDANNDMFVQPAEVVFAGGPLTFGGGFNPASPSSVASADRIDPDLKAPITRSVVVGLERELLPNLAVSANYTWSRLTDVVGSNNTGGHRSASRSPAGSGSARATTSRDAPDRQPAQRRTVYSVQTYIPDAARITANGNGRVLTNYPGYSADYQGVELSIVKRMSNRWMMRAAFSYNNPTESFDGTPVNTLGNPTRRDTDALVEGGQLAPRSAGSGAGDVFVNAGWQINVNGAFQLPWGVEVAGNVFGREGNAFPIFRSVALGRDGSNRVLVTSEVDSFRFDNLWNVDVRLSKGVRIERFSMQFVADLFNVLNANTELNRQRNLDSPNFNRLTSNLSPRILRFGVRLGF